jgi:hypothetical protein
MFVFMHVSTYVCMNECMYVYMYVCLYLCICMSMYIYVCIYIHGKNNEKQVMYQKKGDEKGGMKITCYTYIHRMK